MVSSLPGQNDNHAKGLCKDKCHDCKSSLEYMAAKNGLLTFKCMNWNKTYAKKFDKDSSKRFENTYQIYGGDINKFCVILWRVVYRYKYMDGWERFNETSLTTKKKLFSNLTMKSIIDADYNHIKRVLKRFQNLGHYHDLYVPIDTPYLAEIFENFRNKRLEIYELDPAHFFTAPRLV